MNGIKGKKAGPGNPEPYLLGLPPSLKFRRAGIFN